MQSVESSRKSARSAQRASPSLLSWEFALQEGSPLSFGPITSHQGDAAAVSERVLSGLHTAASMHCASPSPSPWRRLQPCVVSVPAFQKHPQDFNSCLQTAVLLLSSTRSACRCSMRPFCSHRALLPGAAPGRYTKVFLPLSFGADFDPSELVSGGVTAQLATVRFFFQVFYERLFC